MPLQALCFKFYVSSLIRAILIGCDVCNKIINKKIKNMITIISKTFESNEISIKNLVTKDAVYIRRIIEGLRVFINKQIEIIFTFFSMYF